MNHLLRQAEYAVKYVENEVPYGAPNRVEDENRVRADGMSFNPIWPPGAPTDRHTMLMRMDQFELRRLSDGPMNTGPERLRELATLTKRWGVGTCIGMSAVAFDYLVSKEVSGVAVFGLQQCDHALVVLGLSAEPQPFEAFLSGNGAPASWSRAAVVCDPWYHEWFLVSEWPRKFRQILTKTLPGPNQTPPETVRAKCLAYVA